MKVVLIGASGFVGKAILNELSGRGHHIIAVVRNAEKVLEFENVLAVSADMRNESTVSKIVQDADVVVSAYNPGWNNPNLYEEFLAGSTAIQNGVKKSGAKRLIVVGGAGSLYIGENQIVDTPDFPQDWKAGALAARDYLNSLRKENDLDWTFLSPAIEMHPGTSGIRTGKYRTGLDNPVFADNGRSVISVEDLGVAIADEVENPKHIRERFTVAY